ncbi:hypothetical protein BKP35_08530 [Anaerobacillus arseniciselenatis]|uniref:Uncharacterized protein n=1 Tax=Anaerobacillus arseniciselenatis TaxID=85682 RepID=A0A1S2LNA4_9BACI|nr:hypothetical protein [Anaerobacillus arseniciselenatis]OIJ13814.1 hypothetical protein BKP35_08530 [Anaerobacillus arseniciselenatis]
MSNKSDIKKKVEMYQFFNHKDSKQSWKILRYLNENETNILDIYDYIESLKMKDTTKYSNLNTLGVITQEQMDVLEKHGIAIFQKEDDGRGMGRFRVKRDDTLAFEVVGKFYLVDPRI